MPANAASQLRAVLPPELTARMDLGRMTRVQGSFVDEELKWRHTDLLFSVPLDGREAFVYFLYEHQSREDKMMALRILRYITSIWTEFLRAHDKAERLPAVIPVVVYHDSSRWRSSAELLDLIDLGADDKQALGPWLPRFRFMLDDLTRAGEDELRARDAPASARATLLVLKASSRNQVTLATLQEWNVLWRAVLDEPDGPEKFKAFVTYINNVGEVPAENLGDWAASLGPDAKEAFVTTAEMLEARGEARGKALGEALGEARGEARGKAKAVLGVLEQRGIAVDGRSRELIGSCTDLDILDGWLRRALTAGKASDLFQD